MSFLQRLFQRSNNPSGVERADSGQLEPDVAGSASGIRTHIEGDAATVTIDLDEFGSDAHPLLLENLSQSPGLPVFRPRRAWLRDAIGRIAFSMPALQRRHPPADGALHLCD
jgi:hypothetical protein